MRARLPISASRLISAIGPVPPTPITAIRPPVASDCRFSARFAAPTSSSTTSKGPCSPKPSGAITRAPSFSTSGAQLLAPHRRGHARAGSRPSWTAAVPTPPAAPWTSRRSPGRSPAWVKTASWAVVKTSGSPPAWGQSRPLGHRHRGALVHDRQLRLAAAAHHRHHAVADLEALGARPAAPRPRRPARGPGCPPASPAGPGRRRAAGACRPRSGPPRARAPAPRRAPGSGSGRCSTTSFPSWIVTARTRRESTPSRDYFPPSVVLGCLVRDDGRVAHHTRFPAAALAGGSLRAGGGRAAARPDPARRGPRRRSRPARRS